MSHQIKYTRGAVKHEEFHHGRCRCGQTSGALDTLQMVQDWARKHLADMERIRLMQRGHGTDAGDLHYFQTMAANPEVGERDRELWQQLADQLDRRLHGRDTRYTGDVPLEL